MLYRGNVKQVASSLAGNPATPYTDEMKGKTNPSDPLHLAERVRDACIDAALAGYEDAAMSGLCHEGAWEAAISAIRRLDLPLVTEVHTPKSENPAHDLSEG